MERPIIKPIIFNEPDEEIIPEIILENIVSNFKSQENSDLKPVYNFDKIALSKPENWNTEIQELETFFKTIILPKEPVFLNPHTCIKDLPLFIKSHLSMVKGNNGNQRFLPYLHRLQELKDLLKNR